MWVRNGCRANMENRPRTNDDDGGTRVAGAVRGHEPSQHETEERYRLIIESARDYAIFTIDNEAIVTSWAPGAEAVFGWSSEEMIGQPFAITFVPDDVAFGVPE